MAGRVLPSRSPCSSALRSSAVREWSASAPRSVGLAVDHPEDGEQLVADLLALGPGRADGGGHRDLLQRVGQVLAADPAPADGVLDQASRPGRRLRRRTPPGPAPTFASPSTDASVRARRRAASRRTTDATPNRLAAERRRVVEGLGPSGLLAQLGQRLGRGSAQHQDGAPFRTVLLVSSVSRSARNRSTTRPLRSSSSRDSPTIRPASEVASVPTSARSEVSACCRSAAIWAWRLLLDALLPRPGPAPWPPR